MINLLNVYKKFNLKKSLSIQRSSLLLKAIQTRYFSNQESKKIYTEPLDINQILTVTPARLVPEHIERPDYMRKNYVQPA